MKKRLFIGGMRGDSTNYTIPFIILQIENQSIKFKVLGFEKYSLNSDEVIGYKVRRGGIQFFHKNSQYPSFLVFWGNGKAVAKAIEEIGFKPLAEGKIDDEDYKMHRNLHIVAACIILSIMSIGFLLTMLSN